MRTKCLALLAASTFMAALAGRAGTEDLDFDGDGRADLAVYHAARGDWYIQKSRDGALRKQNWGWGQSQPVSGDYDGDGRADLCVFNGRAGDWYILRSRDSTMSVTRGWGSLEQDPVSGDFDGDGRNDLAVYHPRDGNWYIQMSRDGSRVGWQWGNQRAEPVPGDYDGDRITDCAVYDRVTGTWSIRLSRTLTGRFVNWGWAEAEPVQADFDGDGRTDIAVYHPATGDWYIQKSSDQQLLLIHSGWKNVQPVQADYDGDGRAEAAAYFAQQGNWLIRPGNNAMVQNWGWVEAEAACAAYRVDDDAPHYNVKFSHDYDDDTFEVYGQYPRTGAHPGGVPSTPGVVTPGAGAILPSQVSWLTSRGPSYAKARTVLNLSKVSISGSRCYFTATPAIPWPLRGDKNINAIGILIRNINGAYVGGKCEWVVGSRGWYDCRTNVSTGYNGHTMPASGETVWVGIGDPDGGDEISDLLPTRWP